MGGRQATISVPNQSNKKSHARKPRMKTAFIYTLADPRDKKIRYVGKTINKYERRRSHFYNFVKQSNPKTLWIKELRSLGMKPIMEELESVNYEFDSEWEDAERFWISTLRFYGFDLLNRTSGGNCGSTFSKETCEKIRIAATARMTDSERAHLSMKCTGWKQTDEVKERIAASKRGKPRSPEVRAKLLEGSLKWKQKNGFQEAIRCVKCGTKIKFVKAPKFFMDGIGHIHKKCRKFL